MQIIKIALLFVLICSGKIFSQNSEYCSTPVPSSNWENEFNKLILEFKQQASFNSNSNFVEYTIPVIFHVLHSGQPVGTFPNIVQQQINSQVTVLNQDYQGKGLNYNTYPANAFIQWAINQNLPLVNLDSLGRVKIADISIKFCLAEKDTNGSTLTEPGIERINITSRGWQNPNTFTTPQDLRSYFDNTIKPSSIKKIPEYLDKR